MAKKRFQFDASTSLFRLGLSAAVVWAIGISAYGIASGSFGHQIRQRVVERYQPECIGQDY
jgi:hypothetical protein